MTDQSIERDLADLFAEFPSQMPYATWKRARRLAIIIAHRYGIPFDAVIAAAKAGDLPELQARNAR